MLGLSAKSGPYLISDALEDYFSARERAGSKGLKSDRSIADSRIVPELGGLEVAKIATKRIRDWHTALAAAPKFVRTGKTRPERATKLHDANDTDAVRARRASANRILTVLKAALNHAYRDGHVGTDEPWRRVKPFKGADVPVIRAISAAECVRLVNACEPDFRNLVRAALVTGCRYGELTRMRVGDFNREAQTVTVRLSKAGKARHVALAAEGQRLFEQLTAGRATHAPAFARPDGRLWSASHQQRPLESAS
jgi:integrase